MSTTAAVSSVRVGDTTIAFREWGDPAGRPAVLLHGAASSHLTWAGFAPALAERGYRVIAPDLRGHAGSSRTGGYPLAGFRDDCAGLLDALGLAQVTLVGHSLGGHVAGLVAADQPDRVLRLVLEDPPVPPRRQQDAAQWSRAARMKLYLFGLARRGFDRRGVASVIGQLRTADPAWWAGLSRITAPTMIISGGPASHVAPAWLEPVAQAMPNCTLVTIPVGHRIHSLAPDRFRETVLPFLAGTP